MKLATSKGLASLSSVFFPPELSAQSEFETLESQSGGGSVELLRDLYFRRLHQSTNSTELNRQLAELILDRAKAIMKHPARPQIRRFGTFSENPHGEIALEESLEESPWLNTPEALLMEEIYEKRFSCVALLDCSSSMSGDKHLLASIAIAVLLLEVEATEAGIVAFSSGAKSIKRLKSSDSAVTTLLRFLEQQPKGFTNIHRGLFEGLKQFQETGHRGRKLALLATDGRSTEGEDPAEIAHLYDYLVVLHLHGPGSHLESSQLLAERGKGLCLEVEAIDELPSKVYQAIRHLSRL